MIIRILIIMATGMILLGGCSSSATPDVQASLGQEFVLPVSKTAEIKGENLMLQFTAVNTDSRCPTGAQCVWAGEAQCQFNIKYNNANYNNVIFTEPGSTSGSTQTVFQQYKVNFQLQPYPEINKTILPGDYKVTMKVSK